jgi:hypothetical protein
MVYGGGDHKEYIFQTIGCGGVFLDYDNDGWLDSFLLSGNPLSKSNRRDASNRLFKKPSGRRVHRCHPASRAWENWMGSRGMRRRLP